MSKNTAQFKEPLTEATFDIKNMSVTKPYNNDEYKFTKYFLKYKYPDTTSDNVVVRLNGLKVRKAFPPFKKNGETTKYPKVFVLFELANKGQLDMINQILEFSNKTLFENRTNNKSHAMFDTYEEFLEAEKLSTDNIFRNEEEPMVIGVSFPLQGFAAEGDQQAVTISYVDKENPPVGNVTTCGDIDVMLPRGSICDVFYEPQSIKVEQRGGAYSLMTTVHKSIRVTSYSQPSVGGGSGKINGVSCSDFDVETIVLGDRDPEMKNRIKPKMTYTTSKGEEKQRSISLNLKNVDVYLSRKENIDNDTGETKYSWSMAVSLDEEQAGVIEAIETHLYNEFISDSKKILGKKKTNKSHPMGFDDVANFRISLRPPSEKSDKHTIWLSVFCKNQGDEVPDFCNNFYKPGDKDETFTNEEVMELIVNRRHTGVDLNMYVKHIWFMANGNQSLKWALGNATVDPSSIGGDFNIVNEPSVFADVTSVDMGGAGSAFTDVTTNNQSAEDSENENNEENSVDDSSAEED